MLFGLIPQSFDNTRKVEAFEKWIGHQPAVLSIFVNLFMNRSEIDRFMREVTAIWQSGHVPMVILQPMFESVDTTSPTIERQIANGKYDKTLSNWTESLVAWLRLNDPTTADRRIYINFAPEMNGDWIPWGVERNKTSPEDFIRMWHRVHDHIMGGEVDHHHVQWVWAPNIVSGESYPAESFYPGDEYVDWIGIHGYNWGDSQSWSEWRTPKRTYRPTIERVRDIADKPLALTEFGSSSRFDDAFHPEKKADWIEASFQLIRENDIRMACWFNVEKETDWAIFGGSRGTDTFEYLNSTYNVYSEYKDAVIRGGALPSRSEHPRRLSTDEFEGTLEPSG